MSIQLILIRHTSLDISPGICYGQSNIDVGSTFVEEAMLVKKQLEQYKVDKAYTSPLQRCTKLADFCGYPNAIQENSLLELNFGDWEGQKWDDINDPNLALWYENWIDIPTTNGESFMMQYQRYTDFMEKLKFHNNNKTISLFTHSGILHCAKIYQGIDNFDNTFNHKFNYGEVLSFEI